MTAPMDIQEAAKVLRAHQEWRKGGDGPQTNVTSLTQAIDAAVAALEVAANAKPVAWMHPRGPHCALYAQNPTVTQPDALPLYAAPQPAYCCDTITERARELIGLHLSEQEGLVQPTAAQFMAAVDALAQAIGAAEATPRPEEIPTLEEMREILRHPRERAMHQDAARGNFRYQQEDDGA